MNSGHDTKTNGDLRTNPPGEGGEGCATTFQKLNESTSSSESETFPLVSLVSQTDDEDNDTTPIQTIPKAGHVSTTSSVECSPKVAFKITTNQLDDSATRPESTRPSCELVGSTTQFPPAQVMERPGGGDRIPDYVFARTKSTAPMEWSTASNESLFSIYMGNMSFNKDRMSWASKSEDLGKAGGEFTMMSPLNNNNSNRPVQATEAKAAEIMRQVIRESAHNRDKDDFASSNISRQPNQGTQSFAFPILTGEAVSIKAGGGKQTPKSRPETPKSSAFMGGGANRVFDQHNKWLSCFCCFRPFCS